MTVVVGLLRARVDPADVLPAAAEAARATVTRRGGARWVELGAGARGPSR
ncbi:hypothetical protein [Cellulomonas sp. Marseille-Q8402]